MSAQPNCHPEASSPLPPPTPANYRAVAGANPPPVGRAPAQETPFVHRRTLPHLAAAGIADLPPPPPLLDSGTPTPILPPPRPRRRSYASPRPPATPHDGTST
ncbi:hypothetical protein ZWY2020_038269 [Hordeum vulgare]|nr:hypothetical protein ZWY2020_038269 [Hordeum vulgare]